MSLRTGVWMLVLYYLLLRYHLHLLESCIYPFSLLHLALSFLFILIIYKRDEAAYTFVLNTSMFITSLAVMLLSKFTLYLSLTVLCLVSICLVLNLCEDPRFSDNMYTLSLLITLPTLIYCLLRAIYFLILISF